MTARLKITLLAGAGLLLLQLGWIAAVAPHLGIDEFDHALRASSVAQGHWEPGDNPPPKDLGRGDLIPVRKDVAESIRAACEFRVYTGKYNCEPFANIGNGEVLIASGAARYNPTFYAIVGIPASLFHGTANLYALRIATALVACALFMLVVWLAAGRAKTRWPLGVLGLAALPTTVYSASIATPNGLEMISGLGTWVALLALVEADDVRRRRSAYLLLGLFVALLANLHTMGPVWLALIFVAVAILHGPVKVARSLLPQKALESGVALATLTAVAAEIVWVLVSGANDPSTDPEVITASPWGYVINGMILWPLQAVGAFPMRNDQAPGSVYILVLTVLVTVAVMTLRRTTLRSRAGVTLGFVALMSFVVPAVLTVVTFSEIGAAWQGRYGMPFTVGLLVLAGRQLDTSAKPAPRFRALGLVAVGAMALAQVVSQWSVLTTLRAHADLVTGTNWYPPSLFVLVGLGVLATTCWVGILRTDKHTELVHEAATVNEAELLEVPA